MNLIIVPQDFKNISERESELSIRLGVPISVNKSCCDGYFRYKKGRLELIKEDQVFYFDIVAQWQYHLKRNYSVKKELLAKSLGLNKDRDNLIWDISCGTGKDSTLILSFGAKLVSFERSTHIAVLLEDAFLQLKDTVQFAFYPNDFRLNQNLENPDVIYFDPMYPEKKKSALPRKEMLIIRDLVGDDLDSYNVFLDALKIAKKRVVVKRPLHGESIHPNPDIVFKGKSTRYDVYLI